MKMYSFHQISHTADLKIVVLADTLSELFIGALRAMFFSLRPEVKGCHWVGEVLECDQLPITHHIDLTSSDTGALLIDFLSEALYLSDAYNEVFIDALVSIIDEKNIVATIRGVSLQDGSIAFEIKAVTYHDLIVEQRGNGWYAQVVFDI